MSKFGASLVIFSCLAGTVLAAPNPAAETKPAAGDKPAQAAPKPVLVEPSESQIQLARETVQAVGLHQQIEGVILQFRRMAAREAAEIAPANATEAQKKVLAAFQTSLQALATESANRMLRTYARAYLAVFSPVEMTAIRNFYISPEGRAFLAKQPQLARAIGPSLQEFQTELNQKLATLLQQTRKDAGLPPLPEASKSAAPAQPKK